MELKGYIIDKSKELNIDFEYGKKVVDEQMKMEEDQSLRLEMKEQINYFLTRGRQQ